MLRFLTVASCALALAACVDDNADSGLTILRNIAPASGCAVAADSTAFVPSGTIQADAIRGYYFTPVARNDLSVINGENESQKVIFVEGAHITIDFADPDLFTKDEQAMMQTDGLTRFAAPASGGIDPDGGVATFGFEIVPTQLLALIAARLPEPTADNVFPATVLNVGVKMYGRRAGDTIESNLFRYPVSVCDGCILSVVGSCTSLPDGFMGAPGGACNVLQDGALECCTNASGGLVCPAVKPTTQS